jgi:hypothetical protein
MGVIMGVIHIICENPHLRFQRHEMMKLLLLKAHWITSFVTICLLSCYLSFSLYNTLVLCRITGFEKGYSKEKFTRMKMPIR